MSRHNTPDKSAWNTRRLSLEDIERALDGDLDPLTDEEIVNGPQALISDSLDRLGVKTRRLSGVALRQIFADGRPSTSVREGLQPVVPKGFVAAVAGRLHEERLLTLQGPAGSGKSFFLRKIFLREAAVRRAIGRVVYLDCAALRMKEPPLFEREAVWAQFGTNDGAFRTLLVESREQSQKGQGALVTLLRRRLAGGGLVIFDNMDYIERSGPMDGWLSQILPMVKEIGGLAICVRRSPQPSFKKPLAALRDVTAVEFPRFTQDDIETWLKQPLLRMHAAAGLTSAAVLQLTGGVATLLSELGAFLKETRSIGGAALELFASWRLSVGFMPDCERFIRAARGYPNLLEKALIHGSAVKDVPTNCWPDLLATGVVRDDGDGYLTFASPLFASRLKTILQPETYALCLMRTKLRQLLAEGYGRRLWAVGELAADAVAKSMAFERDPVAGLTGFQELLRAWGLKPPKAKDPQLKTQHPNSLKPAIYVRDRDNARLWSPFDRPEGLGPLFAWRQPDFARAVQTGAASINDEGRVFIPLTGNSGMVEMVIMGRFGPEVRDYRRGIELARLVGLMRGLRPTLAQVMERLAVQRERRFEKRMLYLTKMSRGASRYELFAQAGCHSIAILEREDKQWAITRCERTGASRNGFDALGWAGAPSFARLEEISSHPSRRGLVLSRRELWDVFPKLTGEDAAVYLHPVRRNEQECFLVAFLFIGDHCVLDGKLQYRLSVVAPNVLAMVS